MTRLAVVHPTTLLGEELRERLEEETGLWTELHLLSDREEEIGVVTEVAGSATFVDRVDPALLEQCDLVFICDDGGQTADVLPLLPAATAAILLSPTYDPDLAPAAVYGIAGAPPPAERILCSPHPAVVALTRLLAPWRGLGLEEASTTAVQPASVYGESAMEEVFSQTRSLLSFQPIDRDGIFSHQLAFNLLESEVQGTPLSRQLSQVLQSDARLSLQVLQAGVFHGLSVSTCCHFTEDPGLDRLRRALEESPLVELCDDEPGLGPVDAASRQELLIGSLSPGDASGTYWVWAVCDHLALSAHNALGLASQLLGTRV